MIALDTNVLIDIFEGSPPLVRRATAGIEAAAGAGALVVCGAVFAELCAGPHRSPDEIAASLRRAQISIATNLPIDVWRAAGLAYASHAKHRRDAGGETPRRMLTDFVVGAHAATVGALVTSDAAFFRRAFPDLRVIDPRDVPVD